MDKRDINNLSNIYNDILIKENVGKLVDEGISGSYLQGLQAAQSGKINPFEDPKSKEKQKDYLNLKNKPTVGNKVIKKDNTDITGIVQSTINSDGQYEILLLSPYVYIETKKYPKGGIFNKNKALSKGDKVINQNDRITVGFDTKFPYWQDYEQYRKQGLKNF